MRIVEVVWSLHPGGAERVMANLANRWTARGHEVTIVTFRDPSTDFYELDEGVARVCATDLSRVPTFGIGKLERLRQPGGLRAAIKRLAPDVVVSAINITNVQAIWAARRSKVPVIVAEHIQPSEEVIGGFWQAMRTRTYKRADAVVMLTEQGAAWARGFVPDERVHVIPNFIDLPPAAPAHRGGTKRLLTVGRMRRQKGLDLLLEAFAASQARQQGWTLRIIGDGPEREAVMEAHRRLGLGDAVEFPGRTKAIWEEYAEADVYVMSSRFEGFPMVLLEAMAIGMPVISYDCPTGPAELISDGANGLLLPPEDVPALTRAIDRMAADEGLRHRLGYVARGVRTRYAPDRVLARWDELFSQVGVSG